MARQTVTIKHWDEYDHIDWDEQHEAGHNALSKAVADAAAEHGWPDNWLAELPAPPTDPDDPTSSVTVFYHPHLQVWAASPPHLLCMLLLGGRRQEVESLARLLPLVPDVRTADGHGLLGAAGGSRYGRPRRSSDGHRRKSAGRRRPAQPAALTEQLLRPPRPTKIPERTYPYTIALKFGISIGLSHKHRREAPERAAVIMGFHPGRASQDRGRGPAPRRRSDAGGGGGGGLPAKPGSGRRFSRSR